MQAFPEWHAPDRESIAEARPVSRPRGSRAAFAVEEP